MGLDDPHVKRASDLEPERRIASGDATLDAGLGGGLLVGAVSEWGLGTETRELVLRFAAVVSQTHLAVWCYRAEPGLSVYPPAWAARGINLHTMRFAYMGDAAPVSTLKPLFLSPLFRFIVLDCPKRLTVQEGTFLAIQARRHQQHVVVLRPWRLTTVNGAAWARQRVNAWREDGVKIEAIRGGH